jgi:hypothetical protein
VNVQFRQGHWTIKPEIFGFPKEKDYLLWIETPGFLLW